jgi:hypothetical protein
VCHFRSIVEVVSQEDEEVIQINSFVYLLLYCFDSDWTAILVTAYYFTVLLQILTLSVCIPAITALLLAAYSGDPPHFFNIQYVFTYIMYEYKNKASLF